MAEPCETDGDVGLGSREPGRLQASLLERGLGTERDHGLAERQHVETGWCRALNASGADVHAGNRPAAAR